MKTNLTFTNTRRIRTSVRHSSFVIRHSNGFALLEIILAMALFSIVAVGMTRALDQIAQTTKSSRQEAQVLRVLESVLAEVAHQPELKPRTISFPKTSDGIDASASIEKVRLFTQDKAELDKMFRIRAEAWLADGASKRSLKRQMETYVYSPASP
jgi:prepilin-type N-terminal cleavage/methylation domain-containing protein